MEQTQNKIIIKAQKLLVKITQSNKVYDPILSSLSLALERSA